MSKFVVMILVLALFNEALSHRILSTKDKKGKKAKKEEDGEPAEEAEVGNAGFDGFDMFKNSGFDLKMISNASSEKSLTQGATMSMGTGKTSISSSIGKGGAINNVNATGGGKSATSFNQIADNKASSQSLVKNADGSVTAVENASSEKYNMQSANNNAFLGQGKSSVGIGKEGIVANVNGAKGAANADSFNKVDDNSASSKASDKQINHNVAPKKKKKDTKSTKATKDAAGTKTTKTAKKKKVVVADDEE